ncbi:hypothetical protein TCON_1645 [Astathelohania contejeani]|uniref:Uncharacterized protein n=1 Tax=Astathelohania contejeani TaxID=164912 RepID=A0ABQ7HY75_9MICR|nr:hypothetical protein TCON_1645 [Thelohania contejeani]
MINKGVQNYIIKAFIVQLLGIVIILLLKTMVCDIFKYLMFFCFFNIFYLIKLIIPFTVTEIKEEKNHFLKTATENKRKSSEKRVCEAKNEPVFQIKKKWTAEKGKKLTEKQAIKKLGIGNLSSCKNKFRIWLLKSILDPFIRGLDSNVNDIESSFNISFLSEDCNSDATKIKQEMINSLKRNLNNEHIKIIKRIVACGWVAYDYENGMHRQAVFFILCNYFNSVLPKYNTHFAYPFDEFVNNGLYGLNVDKHSSDIYFFIDGSVYDTGRDPVCAFLYLLIYCYKSFGAMLGSLSIRNLDFLKDC